MQKKYHGRYSLARRALSCRPGLFSWLRKNLIAAKLDQGELPQVSLNQITYPNPRQSGSQLTQIFQHPLNAAEEPS